MKTYKQKLEELRLLSLRNVEAGLTDENESIRFVNSLLFFSYVAPEKLDQFVPVESGESLDNEVGAEILTGKDDK